MHISSYSCSMSAPQSIHFQVLVLGSGHVAPPLLAYLTRKATEVCVVSVEQKELSALKRMPGMGDMGWPWPWLLWIDGYGWMYHT